MMYGKSLLIGQIVAAREVGYDDCKTFQIVCPVCFEGVFKCGAFGNERQYFAHYARKEDASCDLRVNAMRPEAIRELNVIGRGQALEKFLGVLRQSILHDVERQGISATDVQRLADRRMFRTLVYDVRCNLKDFDGVWERSLSSDTVQTMTDRSNREIARDVMRHLISANANANLRLATAAALMIQAQDPDPDVRMRAREIAESSDRQLQARLKQITPQKYRELLIMLFAALAGHLLFFPFVQEASRLSNSGGNHA